MRSIKKQAPSSKSVNVIPIAVMCHCTWKIHPHEHPRDAQGNELWNWNETRAKWGLNQFSDGPGKLIANEKAKA